MLVSSWCLFVCTPAATAQISPLSLHDALPILHLVRRRLPRVHARQRRRRRCCGRVHVHAAAAAAAALPRVKDRKSTRLNSSHLGISYAVFCLKKKINNRTTTGRIPTYNSYISK